MINYQNGTCMLQSFITVLFPAQSDEASLCTHLVAYDLIISLLKHQFGFQVILIGMSCSRSFHLNCIMTKPVFGVSFQVRHKQAVQPQKMARGWKFRILEVEGLYYLCSKNKGAVTTQLICPFVFTLCKKQVFS